MTNNDKVEVIQADRDAAARILRLYGAENYAVICKKGIEWCDQLAVVQAFASYRQSFSRTPDEIVESLWSAIQHGDEEHRVWLKEAIVAHFAGRAVPPPRGSGRKEVLIAEIVEALEEARGYVEGNHDEGCELDAEYGEQNRENRETDDDGEFLDDSEAHCTCGAVELLARIDAALSKARGHD